MGERSPGRGLRGGTELCLENIVRGEADEAGGKVAEAEPPRRALPQPPHVRCPVPSASRGGDPRLEARLIPVGPDPDHRVRRRLPGARHPRSVVDDELDGGDAPLPLRVVEVADANEAVAVLLPEPLGPRLARPELRRRRSRGAPLSFRPGPLLVRASIGSRNSRGSVGTAGRAPRPSVDVAATPADGWHPIT